MSEMRHFQGKSGCLYTPYVPENFEADPDWTEVQVAPLDAIVIRREELPEVSTDSSGDVWAMGICYDSSNAARTDARRLLAVAEYLDANPPVDPEQVEALAKDLSRVVEFGTTTPYADAAERPIRAGWSK